MIRRIIEIDTEKCNGCGACAEACHEGAIAMVQGKATLMRDDYCDGLGDCLPACPAGAITFVEREAAAYDEAAVVSKLRHWPVQIKLLPVTAPHFQGAHLLIAADCTAYAYGTFHTDFIKGKVAMIGCPKLDQIDYSEKLSAIFANNDIAAITVVRMEVPCCGGLQRGVEIALEKSGKRIPCKVVTISTEGKILG